MRRHVIQLLWLIGLASGAFFGTRLLAHRLEALRWADAQVWFARGQAALARGDVESSIADFHQADLKRPGQKVYVLHYADALRRGSQVERAERALLALRESAPDDVDVNLALARLADAEGDRDEAIRYYRNGLYAPWSDAAARRRARFEFIGFLLRLGDNRLARAELLAASNDLPDTAAAHVETGRLLFAAGESSAAREQFSRALQFEPGNAVAQLGAGRAAFELKDFSAAQRLLRGLPLDAADDRKLHVAELILSLDPLAVRLSRRERSQRTRRLLDAAAGRLNACHPVSGAPPAGKALLEELRAASASLTARSPSDESFDETLRLAARAARAANRACGAVPLDDALIAISDLHERDER